MALVLADRVKETSATGGTGIFTLLGAVNGFQSFGVIGNNNTTYYAIVGQTSNEWEVGLGTYTSSNTRLARTTVYASSNANQLVNFSNGTKDVFVTLPSSVTLTSGDTPSFATLNLTGTTNQISSVAVTSFPEAPAENNLKTFATTQAGGYTAPAFRNPTNAPVQLQPAFANRRISMVVPQLNVATLSVVGFPGAAVAGTATTVAVNVAGLYGRAVKVNYVSAATAAAFAAYYFTSGYISLGVPGSPNVGGFYYVIRFGFADIVASPRTFIGLASSAIAPTNVEPSTLVNCIGVGQGASDTNLKLYYGGSAAQTPIDLGINFPTNTQNTDLYELTLFAPPTVNNTVYYQVVRQNTGQMTSGTLTGTAGTTLPSNNTLLIPRNWRTNNATLSAVRLAIAGIYLETDF
jgi:hypothetical protein